MAHSLGLKLPLKSMILEERGDPGEVLLRQRPVQAVRADERLDLLRWHARRAEAIGGVARRGVHDEEHDHRDADEDGDRLDDPAKQVLRHLAHYLAGHTGEEAKGHVGPSVREMDGAGAARDG